jgi:L-fuculose-phosphate aldolase
MARFIRERQDIADMCRRMADNGYFSGTGGNIGLRLDDGLFAVTPSATDYYAVRAEDVGLLRLDTLEQIEGDRTPSVEKGLHASMLGMYPARRASLHTHQPIASAVTLLHEPLSWSPGTDLSALGRHVALVPYRPSGTGMLVRALRKALEPDTFAYLLASHGVICAATDLRGAAEMVRQVEAAAALFLRRRIEGRADMDDRLRSLILNTLTTAVSQGTRT